MTLNKLPDLAPGMVLVIAPDLEQIIRDLIEDEKSVPVVPAEARITLRRVYVNSQNPRGTWKKMPIEAMPIYQHGKGGWKNVMPAPLTA